MNLWKMDSHAGEGLKWVYDNASWKIGLKNFKPQNSFEALETLELHRKTDETFILLAGSCCILAGEKGGGFSAIMMEAGTTYTIPSGLWHTTVTAPGVSLVLVEASDTSMENSELWAMSEAELASARAALRAAGFPG